MTALIHPVDLFPSTRYAGSKRKLLGLLAEVFGRLSFHTVLDPFCGTGTVSYLLKCMGKAVTSSDVLISSAICARALVENQHVRIENEMERILAEETLENSSVKGVVEQQFTGIFFTDDENRFLDRFLACLSDRDGYLKDLLLYSLFQACLSKRPYNLFHRANLSMRTRNVARTFGNKATWETPFPLLLRRFAAQADAAVFDSAVPCRSMSGPISSAPEDFDLVYLDPPYVSGKGAGVDYLDFYHFLEGLVNPEDWPKRILYRYRHRPLAGKGENPWSRAATISAVFEETIQKFSGSKLVVSYRSDGIPSIPEIVRYLTRAGKQVQVLDGGSYTYALSRNKTSREVVIIGE